MVVMPVQRIFCCVSLILVLAAIAPPQETRVVLDRGGGTIVLEPYASNIIRVTLSLLKQPALAPPGYGFTAKPAADGWSHEQMSRAMSTGRAALR
jgi:alpha-D-xyloside xylohydrolase